jgi:hypothetical protein
MYYYVLFPSNLAVTTKTLLATGTRRVNPILSFSLFPTRTGRVQGLAFLFWI